MRSRVIIIGGGPSGLLLGQLLHRQGIDTVVLERKTRDYVLSRIRAGVLERGVLALMDEAGIDARMHREGYAHDGTLIAFDNESFRLSFKELTGHSVMVYGQTELTRDLYDAREASGAPTIFEVEDVALHDLQTDHPHVTYRKGGQTHRIDGDFVAGCDGFHGVSRRTIPEEARTEIEKVYPFGWLGVLSETPPVHDELIYSTSTRGFALCSMRNANLSRYYVQCRIDDNPAKWTDADFWDELRRRIPERFAEALITGPTIEKSIAPLRSFVCAPMQWGRLFLCGDAAHIVPPTGAKGLNTAASDVHYLYHALRDFYADSDRAALDGYSEKALLRVWKAERFSWWFSSLLHRSPDQNAFDLRMQRAELEYLRDSETARKAMAENYVGLPY